MTDTKTFNDRQRGCEQETIYPELCHVPHQSALALRACPVQRLQRTVRPSHLALKLV